MSTRHHILPQFYLKGFTNNDGKFAVYDCEQKRIKKGYHVPKSHFYIENRNTVEIFGQSSDFPEKVYAKIDSETSKIFKKIQGYKGVPKLSVYEMAGLQFFLSDLFWRNPINDEQYANSLNTPFLRQLFRAVDPLTGEEKARGLPKEVVDDKKLLQSFRPIAGALSFDASEKTDYHNWRIGYHPYGGFICSDNPFVMGKENAKDIFDTAFAFPLTKHHVLVRSFQAFGSLPASIMAYVQIAIFKQGVQFCAGPNKEFLNLLLNDPTYYSIDFLKDHIFGFLEFPGLIANSNNSGSGSS